MDSFIPKALYFTGWAFWILGGIGSIIIGSEAGSFYIFLLAVLSCWVCGLLFCAAGEGLGALKDLLGTQVTMNGKMDAFMDNKNQNDTNAAKETEEELPYI